MTRCFEVVDLRAVDAVCDLSCFNCFVITDGPTVLAGCKFDCCDLLVVHHRRFLVPAELVDVAGKPINPLTLGSTCRRLLAHLLPSDLVPQW